MKVKNIIRKTILFIAMGTFCFAAYQAIDLYLERKNADDAYSQLDSFVSVSETNPNQSGNEGNEDTTDKVILRHLYVDFDALKETNPDFIGWLYLPNDTIINYPVVQGEDNEYYLKHMFDGKQNGAGTLFLDYQNEKDFSDDNRIIYGHHMKGASMFHALDKYKSQAYYEEHPYFYFETPDGEYRLEVFASYVSRAYSNAFVTDFNNLQYAYGDENGENGGVYKYDEIIPTFTEWYNFVVDNNMLSTNIEVNEGDKIYTFSTCDYSFSNARFVVHCKAVNTADSYEFGDPIVKAENSN